MKNARDFRGIGRRSLLDFRVAEDMAISDVARVFGLRTSAIRYYEQIGILRFAQNDNMSNGHKQRCLKAWPYASHCVAALRST